MTDSVLVFLGSVGWGLLACGALTHWWHHRRLRVLLARHFDHERIPAVALTVVEVVLVAGVVFSIRSSAPVLRIVSVAAAVLAAGFMVWTARLLLTGSDLPCACSFSDAPTTWLSFGRSVCVGLVVCFAFVNVDTYTATTGVSETVATMVVGWAAGSAIFVLPEAVSWPTASKALLARVEAHTASTSLTNGER